MPCSDPSMHHGGPRVPCGIHTELVSRAAPAQREVFLFLWLRTPRQRQHGSVSDTTRGNRDNLGTERRWQLDLRTREQDGWAGCTGRKYLEVGRQGKDPAGVGTRSPPASFSKDRVFFFPLVLGMEPKTSHVLWK